MRGAYARRHGLELLGAGIGLRREHFDALPKTARRIDWLEVIPENFLTFGGKPRRTLDACVERWPIVSHGLSLNLGGPDVLDAAYLDQLRSLTRRLASPFFSDHLAYSALGGRQLHDLLPLPFSREAVAHVVPRLRQAMDAVELPFALENPTYYARMPGSELDEAAFLRAVAEEADCGLLLDVNNVYVNSRNHGYDPKAFLEALPLERVVQVHLAGHHLRGELIIDTHGAPVADPVWELYRYLLSRIGPVSTLIEWDHELPALEVVLDEADRARTLLQQAPPDESALAEVAA